MISAFCRVFLSFLVLVSLGCKNSGSNQYESKSVVASPVGKGTFRSTDSTIGTRYTTFAIEREFEIKNDGTYIYTARFSDNVGCASPTTAGGTIFAISMQSGTWENEGAATSPAGAVKVKFTTTVAELTLLAASLHTEAVDLATYAQAMCTAWTGGVFSGTADETRSVFGTSFCTPFSGISVLTPLPTSGSSTYQIFSKSGADMQTGSRRSVLFPGDAAYPTAFTDSYLAW